MKKSFFNNHTIITGLLFLSGITISCKKLIDIPGNLPTQIQQSQEFADSASTMGAVAGVYSYPSNGGGTFTFNDGYLSLCTGLTSDELSTTVTFIDAQALYNYSLTPFNSYMNNLWSNPYAGVYPVNAILTEVPLSPGLSASFKKEIVAEMKVVRSLYYFNLLNLFGAVPLVTSIDYKTTTRIPRSSVDSVYSQILRDLTDAQQALPMDYPSAGRYRPNLYVVSAFLAKVHLYRQEWQAAYDAAGTVIGSNIYNLENDLNNVFLDGSQEAIWQLPATGSYQVTMDAANFVPYTSGTAPIYPLTSHMVNAFESGDQRLQDWTGSVVLNGGSGPNVYYPYKYKNISASAPTTEDFMIFRLAEQYLIRAEAAAHLGKGSDALADVNIVRARAGLGASTADPASQSEVLNAIMHERQVELFTEWGNRWFDLKRTGMADAVLGTEKTGWQPYAALYPVPHAQVLLDGLLSQNPGYH
jgi:hypothetical protein